MLTNHIEVKQILKLANSAIHFSPKANTKKKKKQYKKHAPKNSVST